MTDLSERLREIDALYEKATKGPWKVTGSENDLIQTGAQAEIENVPVARIVNTKIFYHNGLTGGAYAPNADFIVALVNLWPLLSEAPRERGRDGEDARRIDGLEKMRATIYSSHDVGANYWVVVDETKRERKGNVAKTLRAAIDAAMKETGRE